MKFSAIPSDSLYKWLAISGMVLAIFSGYTFINFVWEHRIKLDEYSTIIDMLFWGSLFFMISGLIMSLIGFRLWYLKLQKFIDQEQKYRALEQEYKAKEQELSLEAAKSKIK